MSNHGVDLESGNFLVFSMLLFDLFIKFGFVVNSVCVWVIIVGLYFGFIKFVYRC